MNEQLAIKNIYDFNHIILVKIVRNAVVILVSLGLLASLSVVLVTPAGAGHWNFAGEGAARGNTVISGIKILGNGDFSGYASAGNGTEENPYILDGLYVNATGSTYGIWIENTTAHFILLNVTVVGADNNSAEPWGVGIYMRNVQNGTLRNITCEENGLGIKMEHTENITVDGYTGYRDGIYGKYANYTTIENSVVNGDEDGLYLYLSDHGKVSNSTFVNCTTGIDLFMTSFISVSNNTLKYIYEYGLEVSSSHGNIILQNEFLQNYRGLSLSSLTDTERDDVVINNTFYENDRGGVFLSSVTNVSVAGNVFDGNGYGIYLSQSSENRISQNQISVGSDEGIYLYYSSNNEVTGNHLSGAEDEIHLSHSNDVLVKNNDVTDSGIYIDVSSGSRLYSNALQNASVFVYGTQEVITGQDIPENNTVNSKPVMYLKNVDMNNATERAPYGEIILANVTNLKIDGLNFSEDGVGVVLGYTDNITVVNCSFANNHMEGIYGYYSEHTMVEHNTFAHSKSGMYLRSSSYSIVSFNNFDGAGGITTYRGTNYEIFNNTVVRGNVALYLETISNSVVMNNTLRDAGSEGIRAYELSSSEVYDNIITGGYHGLSIKFSSGNLFVGNSISGSTGYGIYATGSNGNWIYNNSLFNNHLSGDKYSASAVQAYDSGGNYWNTSGNPHGYGNYWYDWANNNTTNDPDGDGIVKWSYVIDGESSEDHYPLANTAAGMPPSAPQNLSAVAGRGYVNLSWDAPRDTRGKPVLFYHIYRNNYLLDSVSSEHPWYNFTRAINGLTYKFFVTAETEYGIGQKSNDISVVPKAVPTPPANLTASVGRGYVNLTWEVPEDNGGYSVKNYLVYRNGTLYANVSSTQLWFNDTNESTGTTYSYYVTAVNSVGESAKSNEVMATPGAEVPEFTPLVWLVVIFFICVMARRKN